MKTTIKDLLEAGCHFGHKTSRWHPRFKPYIFGPQNGIYIIDLKKSLDELDKAYNFVKKVASRGGKAMFVGTKKQVKTIVKRQAQRCDAYYVTERWLGGMLTNFNTIRSSIQKLKEYERMEQDGTYDLLTKKEVLIRQKHKKKLDNVLSGIREMTSPPEVMFVVDASAEDIAVKEAKKLKIPVVAMVDTDTDPSNIEFPIPTNDDAMKSVSLITKVIADAVIEGRGGEQYLQAFEEEEQKQKADTDKKDTDTKESSSSKEDKKDK